MTSLPSHARACIVFRRSVDGSRGDRLGTGRQSIQISPYHAGLAGRRWLRLLCASCFAAMLWSLLPVSAPVRRLTFGTFLRFPTRFSGIRFELSRRTARHERTLAGVACMPLFGEAPAPEPRVQTVRAKKVSMRAALPDIPPLGCSGGVSYTGCRCPRRRVALSGHPLLAMLSERTGVSRDGPASRMAL